MTQFIDWTSIVSNSARSLFTVESRRQHSTGFAVSPTLVLASSRGARSNRVMLAQGAERFEGQVVSRSADRDLALISVEGRSLEPLAFAESRPAVGAPVLRLGRPGETLRATAGIVSVSSDKVWRTAKHSSVEGWLEVDAELPAGFSGGPVVDTQGRVVGLQSRGVWRSPSLLIPAVALQDFVSAKPDAGQRAWLGLDMRPLRLPAEVVALTQEEVGLWVTDVAPKGPARDAGIRFGDTLLHLGDDSVKTLPDLWRYLKQGHVGETIPVKLFRDGKVETVQLKLEARPTSAEQP